MKKSLLLVLMYLTFALPGRAQLTVAGSDEYGRIFDITYDPLIQDKLYAVTLGNHIVVSENNGTDWEILYTYPQVSVLIKDLKLLPGNKLAFTLNDNNGYHNNGIYVLDLASLSIDHTFQAPIPEMSETSNISAYDVYAGNPDVAIVQQYYQVGFGTRAKVYYTNDGGTTWSEIYYYGSYDYIFPNNVAISPNDPQKIFIARQGGLDPEDYGGLFISQNAGRDWEEKLSGFDFKSIAFNPDDANTILLGTTSGSISQNLYRTTDGGNTWNAVDINWSTAVAGAITSIKYNPEDADTILVLAEQDIITTSNGFETKQVYHHAEGITNPEGLNNYYYGTNASFNPFTTGEVFISANYFPVFTTDGGATVNRAKQPYFSSPKFTSIVGNNLYYGVQNGFLHKDLTTQTETPAFTTSLSRFLNYSTDFYTDQNIPGRLYFVTTAMMGTSLNISNDNGANFISTSLAVPFMQAIASVPGSPDIVWYAGLDYEDAGALYELNISDPENLQATAIALPETGQLTTMYLGTTATDTKYIAINNHIYRSAENTSGWELASTGLETLISGDRINQITKNPFSPNEIAITTTRGIYTSTDNGTNWNQLGSFTGSSVNTVAYSTATAGQMVAISYDTERSNVTVRYSSDSGQNWGSISAEDLKYVTSYSGAVTFAANTATVYLSTTDLGLVTYTIDFETLGTGGPINKAADFVKLYPNPASTFINLEAVINDVVTKAVIFSVTGQKIAESKNSTIDVSSFNSGIYLIKIETASGKSTMKKFIKN